MSQAGLWKRLPLVVCGLVLLLSSCCRGPYPCASGCGEDPVDPMRIKAGNLIVKGVKTGSALWKDRDAIGISVISTTDPSYTGEHPELFANVKYATLEALSGRFSAATAGIYLPEDMTFDLVAYFPYRQVTSEEGWIEVTDDTSDQLLLSDRVSGVTRGSGEILLTFRPLLSRLVIRLTGPDLSDGSITLEDPVTRGCLFPAEGRVEPTEVTAPRQQSIGTVDNTTGKALFDLIPAQNLKGQEMTIRTGRYIYHYSFPSDLVLKSGEETVVEIVLKEGDGMVDPSLVLIVDGSTIEPMTEVTISAGEISTP